jgi:hypothetical protein
MKTALSEKPRRDFSSFMIGDLACAPAGIAGRLPGATVHQRLLMLT